MASSLPAGRIFSASPKHPFVHFPYQVFPVILRIWTGRTEEPPIDFFRGEVLALPQSDRDVRERMCANWRDLRLAIEEC